MDRYWDRACATFFLNSDKPDDSVRCEGRSLDKFKQCLGCQHFATRCESYTCAHPDGRNCLLQIGSINHFAPAVKKAAS